MGDTCGEFYTRLFDVNFLLMPIEYFYKLMRTVPKLENAVSNLRKTAPSLGNTVPNLWNAAPKLGNTVPDLENCSQC